MRKIEKMWIVEGVRSESSNELDNNVTQVSSRTCIYALCNDNTLWWTYPDNTKAVWVKVGLPEIPQV